jgi:drug/metabolite transporter (DMT)-like permease
MDLASRRAQRGEGEPASRPATAPPPAATRGRRQAIIALLACGLLWSTAGVLIELVDWPPLAIAGVRSLIVAVALLALTRPRWDGVGAVELLAALALAGHHVHFVLANKLASPANAILIQYSSPAWAALLAMLVLHERVTRVDWLAVALAIAGVAIFFVDQLSLDRLGGNAIALGAGITLAVHVVLLRRIARSCQADHDPTLRVIILGHALAAAIGAPFVLTAPALPLSGWAVLVLLGLFQQALPSLLYVRAIPRVQALDALLIPVIEPITSPLWVWLFLDLRPGPFALLGGATVLSAVVIRALVPRKRPG